MEGRRAIRGTETKNLLLAAENIPRLSRKQNIHYRKHKSLLKDLTTHFDQHVHIKDFRTTFSVNLLTKCHLNSLRYLGDATY
jgi:hypothetical protein